MKHFRIYTHTGGVVRFTYDMQKLLEDVNQETQFVGRNLITEGGMVDLNKMAGPDDIEFVVRAIKASADTLDALLPKHIKPEEFRVVVFSDKEATITLNCSGSTVRSVLEQAYEHTRNFMFNTMLRMWYEKVRMGDQAGTYAGHASLAISTLQRVLIHSFITGMPYGSRYPKVDPQDIVRPLKGKFLSSYRTEAARDAVHDSDYSNGDFCYIEEEYDYMVYSTTWSKLTDIVDGLAAGNKLDPSGHIDIPDAAAGDVYFFKRGGTIGEYKDRVYAGEAMLCIATNTSVNSLKNFIVLGPVKADQEH